MDYCLSFKIGDKVAVTDESRRLLGEKVVKELEKTGLRVTRITYRGNGMNPLLFFPKIERGFDASLFGIPVSFKADKNLGRSVTDFIEKEGSGPFVAIGPVRINGEGGCAIVIERTDGKHVERSFLPSFLTPDLSSRIIAVA